MHFRIDPKVMSYGLFAFALSLILVHQLVKQRVSVTSVSVRSVIDPNSHFTADMSSTQAWLSAGKFSSAPRVLEVQVEKPPGIDAGSETVLDNAIQQRMRTMGWSLSPNSGAFRALVFMIRYILPFVITIWLMTYLHRKQLSYAQKNPCKVCGYSLVNLHTNQCPECGKKN